MGVLQDVPGWNVGRRDSELDELSRHVFVEVADLLFVAVVPEGGEDVDVGEQSLRHCCEVSKYFWRTLSS